MWQPWSPRVQRLPVEHHAGEGVGFSDEEYRAAGALLQSEDSIYRNKDLLVKFKGPSVASIEKIQPGHHSFLHGALSLLPATCSFIAGAAN